MKNPEEVKYSKVIKIKEMPSKIDDFESIVGKGGGKIIRGFVT